MVWFGGGRERVYFRYPNKASFGRCSVGKASLPKIGSKWLGPPLHAIEIGKERPKALPIGMRERERERKTHGRTKWIRVCHEMSSGRKRKH